MNDEKILNCLSHYLDSNQNSIKEKDNLINLGFNSLKFIKFILEIEETFSVEINDSDLLFENFNTLEKIKATLGKYLTPTTLKKCLILDCDNVLWKGISGEEDIIIDHDVCLFQEKLISLYKNGVLLCLCSKNEPSFISHSFENPKMLLKKDYIITQKINRKDKATNIKEIIKELNILPDSIVFADDSDYELGYISSILPEITTIKVDYSDISFINKIANQFSNGYTTDIDRTKLYKEQKQREKSKKNFATITEYNNSLETVAICEGIEKNDIKRLSELSMRTNQFNLSNIRYTPSELEKILEDTSYKIIKLNVSDIYGDMGLVGMAVLHNNIIEAFMLSCRVFDRDFEIIILDKLKEICNDQLFGVYVKTEKNKYHADFYTKNGVNIHE